MKTNNANALAAHERELAAGVLKQAADDLRRFHNATSKVERDLYYDAYSWVMSEDYSWPFSFPHVCQILNCAPEALRQELISDLAFGPVGQLVRRCSRAIRRFADAFRQPLATGYDLTTPLPASVIQTSH